MNQIAIHNHNIIGKLIVLLMGMYGIHVYGQVILFDSKGFLPSTFVALWLLLFTLIVLNNTLLQLITQSLKYWYKLLILLFLTYYCISIFFYTNNAYTYHLSNIIIIVLPGFMLGVASDLNYRHFMPFQRLVRILNSSFYAKRIYFFAGLLSILFLSYQAYLFYINKLGLTLVLVTVNNEFYQDFGDYFIIFYCAWLALRENYRNQIEEIHRSYGVFTILLIIELAVAVIFLQLIGSNKAPLTIVLIGISYLFFSIPSSFRLRLRQLSGMLLLVLFIVLFLYLYMDPELLINLRFFGELSTNGITSNSSVTSRLDQLVIDGLDQINRNWIFGDLTIDQYIHSSLITVQTHLGLIGTILFWLFVLVQSHYIYFKRKDRIAKAVTLPIIFVSIISSAFWWLPLWFVIGFIYMRK